MGVYLNPGNAGFAKIVNDRYVDKTSLIACVNAVINTPRDLICMSRPRRFGKSFAAQMLCAYYDRSCDSSKLFEGLSIAFDSSYRRYLNRFNVIYVDMAATMERANNKNVVSHLKEKISDELCEAYPQIRRGDSLSETLLNAVEYTKTPFVMVIDEWDAPIREIPEQQRQYLEFLRGLFKDSGTTSRIFAMVYMTGILPIKKDGSQSALSDFREFSMLDPGVFAPYMGFLESEVKSICAETGLDFIQAQRWYDGYTAGSISSLYNPYSFMTAIDNRRFQSYWRQTSAADSLLTYIDMDYEGLQDDVARLIAGDEVEVDVTGFENDVQTFSCKDDVFTLMIHLGYLTYSIEDPSSGNVFARIPNEEVRQEFEKVLRRGKHPELMRLVRTSDQLLKDTIAGNADAVAAAIAHVHDSNYAPTFYNNEQALRHTVKMAYIGAIDQYLRVEELPSGHGLADVVFIPRKQSSLPAMIIELKWEKPVPSTINQIKRNNYPAVLEGYIGELLLVGIAYDTKTKVHHCTIERWQKAQTAGSFVRT